VALAKVDQTDGPIYIAGPSSVIMKAGCTMILGSNKHVTNLEWFKASKPLLFLP
jgi:hypothetical protein